MYRTAFLGWALTLLLLAGCSCDSGDGSDGSTSGMDGSSTGDAAAGGDGGSGGMDGSTPADGSVGMDGSAPGDGSVAVDAALPDGAVALDGGGVCYMAACSGTIWACGNCIDDDGDGLVDSEDPDCVGACDNNEAGFELMIPGSDTPNCNLDCYYDDDQGSGNDRCSWDSRCDPLEPEAPRCPYTGPGMGVSCPATQSTQCHTNCDAITPNGCDCFGCCELPAGSGSFVFLGSRSLAGSPPCSAATATDPTSCRACTPVADCLNTCERCELCLGRGVEDLPCECYPDLALAPARCRPDAGPGTDAGPTPIDAGPRDAGSIDAGPPPPPRCRTGVQACGLPGDPACPAGYYCQTGCCAYFG